MPERNRLNNILLGGVIVLLILVLIKNSPNYVIAQGDGSARHVFAVVGEKEGNREPFYLVDTRQEVIMVYEYGVQGDGLGLAATRSYKYDKLLEEYGISRFGPNIDKVKKEIEKMNK